MVQVKMVSPSGNREIVDQENIAAFTARGYISDESFCDDQKSIAMQKYQEWLADFDTVQERFQMLRQACESKLAQTDYAMIIDFPIAEESKSALWAYRKAIRELNHQTGAPWDGGGELTPWPEMPVIVKA